MKNPIGDIYVIECKKCGFIGWSLKNRDSCIRFSTENVRATGITGSCDGEVICETVPERDRRLRIEAAKKINQDTKRTCIKSRTGSIKLDAINRG
ncbi:MAG: hypothetical protein E7267_03795 [Lachnospiraceae bacterium]|nr:hypothetical protein [Lachnospiraceae bacterium]